MRTVYLADDPAMTPGVVAYEDGDRIMVWWREDIAAGEWISDDDPFRDRWYVTDELCELDTALTRRVDTQRGDVSPTTMASDDVRRLAYVTRLNEAGAVTLVRHSAWEPETVGPAIGGPEDVYRYFSSMGMLDAEHVVVLAMDVRGNLLGWTPVHKGRLAAVEASPRKMLTGPLLTNAHSIIMLHNHPSGDPSPSTDDEELTDHVARLARDFEMPLRDHIVIGREQGRSGLPYYSFAEDGRLKSIEE